MSASQNIHGLEDALKPSERMPLLFIGHGNPMNAIVDNEFRRSWQRLGDDLPKPQAILCISAHWLTRGTLVTEVTDPRTIHDFGGFPRELFEQEYPVLGSPELSGEVKLLASDFEVRGDQEWGLDHGAWSVLKPMFPLADIPVVQLSINYYAPVTYHYELAQSLKRLREKGVLIIGSGNLVHNLHQMDAKGKVSDWALEFDQKLAGLIEKGDDQGALDFQEWGTLSTLAHPTFDHLLPLFYVLGMKYDQEQPSFFNTSFDLGSISMRSVLFHK